MSLMSEFIKQWQPHEPPKPTPRQVEKWKEFNAKEVLKSLKIKYGTTND
jgi:hypothetical protein